MRKLVGLVHRIAYALLLTMLGWYACIFPEPFGMSLPAAKIVCRTLTFPAAGAVGSACDFCTAQQRLWYLGRVTVPLYVALFYLPALIGWVVRKRRGFASATTTAPQSPC